ncbi:hypothetical protein BC830DRAFT_1113887 [Chytriomyces sp. MP71]|nr:hypothetical protein BC830DRAFT_1113887 [Chytriomyces sp. MP71]
MEALPQETLARMLSFVDPCQLLLLQRVSRAWQSIIASASFAEANVSRFARTVSRVSAIDRSREEDTGMDCVDLDRVWLALPPHFQTAYCRARLHSLERIAWSKTDFVINWIPPALGCLKTLVHFSASKCNLTGGIPPETGGLVALRTLDLSFNSLASAIPAELGNLENLESLHLESNELFGCIPHELFNNLSNLKILCLSNNQLSGPIPPTIDRLVSLEKLYLCSNQLSQSIPFEIGSLSEHLMELDLSRNRLTGHIPAVSVGKLVNLTALFLNDNDLYGPVPRQLGNLRQLEDLYLGRNRLVGNLPPSLGSLKNLQVLHLIGNKLTGDLAPEFSELSLMELYVKDNSLRISDEFDRNSKMYRLLKEEGVTE